MANLMFKLAKNYIYLRKVKLPSLNNKILHNYKYRKNFFLGKWKTILHKIYKNIYKKYFRYIKFVDDLVKKK